MTGSRMDAGAETAAATGGPSGRDDNVLAFPETPE